MKSDKRDSCILVKSLYVHVNDMSKVLLNAFFVLPTVISLLRHLWCNVLKTGHR